jgi:hypothetical protein
MKYILILLFSLPLLVTSCKKKLTSFSIDYTSLVVVQSSFGQALPFEVATTPIDSDSESEFESNDTNKDHIKSIHLQELKLTISSPSGETFSFLKDIELFISSPSMDEKKVAFKNSIPNGVGKTLTCDIMTLDLQAFLMDETFKIRLKATTDETISEDVYIDVYTKYLVDAQLIK